MEITQIHHITFSPTQTSRTVGLTIASGLSSDFISEKDFTLTPAEEVSLPGNALALFTVPVYGGHVAPMALERFQKVKGNSTPAIVVVVYGNRDYEKALQELADFVTERGFKVVAAGTFVGEHSYSSAAHPIAAGRPDKSDLDCAFRFGKQIKQKFHSVTSSDELAKVDVARISRPSQSFFSVLRFILTIASWRRKRLPMPTFPMVDSTICTGCGKCAEVCPSAAIDAANPMQTHSERCIKCCACVKGCPSQARTFDTPFAPLLAQHFAKRKENKVLL